MEEITSDTSHMIPRTFDEGDGLKEGKTLPKYKNNKQERTVMIPRINAAFFINANFYWFMNDKLQKAFEAADTRMKINGCFYG